MFYPFLSPGRLNLTALAAFSCLHLSGTGAGAASAVKLADHPTSRLTGFPGLHSARKLLNRIYFGYGDWNGYCAATLVSYDPAANVLAVEHSVSSDSVEMMREIDGVIYVPHCDPSHHEDFHDYSWRSRDGRWLQSAAMELVHVFDFTQWGENLVCAANNGLNYSGDEGRTWKVLAPSLGGQREYWCSNYKGTVYSSSGCLQNNTFQRVSGLPSEWNHTTLFSDAATGAELLLGLTGALPGIGPYASGLSSFNGTTVKRFRKAVTSFTVQGETVFVLTSGTILKTVNPADAAPRFDLLNITGIPSTASCLELMDGKFYIGTTTGEIWVANADGTPVTVVPPVVENRMPDSYGRGLAFDGDSLLTGAPAAFSGTYLAGKAELWRHGGEAWRPQREWTPPVPDFSGWYGRDVALHGDLMAIVEAGYDKSNRDRGANARVHVQQRMADGGWTAGDVFEVPFAQSVAIQDDIMVVGTSNQAADQADGWPGVIPYTITRDASNKAVLKALPQIKAGSGTLYGYKSLVRVALMDDLLVAGYSGDPSRTSVGAMEVYRRDGAGFSPAAVKKISVSKTAAVRIRAGGGQRGDRRGRAF